jgi:Helix-turn-helix domain
MTRQTQNAQILQHLKEGKEITALTALQLFRSLRLSGRIYDLRAEGHQISSEMVKVGDKHVALYRMAP